MQSQEYKNYIIESAENGPMSRITPKSGRLPAKLEGYWTSPTIARTAIDNYGEQKAKLEADKAPAKVKLTPRKPVETKRVYKDIAG